MAVPPRPGYQILLRGLLSGKVSKMVCNKTHGQSFSKSTQGNREVATQVSGLSECPCSTQEMRGPSTVNLHVAWSCSPAAGSFQSRSSHNKALFHVITHAGRLNLKPCV